MGASSEDTNQFFAGEDLTERVSFKEAGNGGEGETYIDANQVDLGVTVLARLGGGHLNDLARAA